MTPDPARFEAGLVTILLPAKDEASAIGQTMDDLPLQTLETMGFAVEIVVLDGQSTDETVAIARQRGARIVTDEEPGKAVAVRRARGDLRGQYVVMADADGSYALDTIPRMLEKLAWGDTDVVMGVRKPVRGAMSLVNRVGNRFFCAVGTALYGRLCRDVCTGLWAFRTDVLQALPLRSRRFGLEVELFALTARLGMRVAHVPTDYLPRAGATKLRPFRDGARILRRMVDTRFRSLAPLSAAVHHGRQERPVVVQFDRPTGADGGTPQNGGTRGSWAMPERTAGPVALRNSRK